MPAKRPRRGERRDPSEPASGRDSPELAILRAGIARHVLNDAAELLALHYGSGFTPARCRQLLLHAADIMLTRERDG